MPEKRNNRRAQRPWRTPPPPERQVTVKGRVHILEERCKGCGFCIEFCPRQALAQSPHFNEMGYHPPYLVKEGLCANCKICYLICPDFAIYVTEAEAEPTEEVPMEGVAARVLR